jgi:alditol oxidase
MTRSTNWAGNWAYAAAEVHRPASVAEVQEIVARAAKVKALGTRHSFNHAADTDGVHVSTASLNRVLSLDRGAQTVTVEAGITYGDLCCYLREHGLALHNLASLPHISVGGACATATHGSGDRNGSLSSAVSAMDIVTADGEVVRLERGDANFAGAVVHLGALGVVTSLTLEVMPSFNVAQHVYLDLPFHALETQFDAVFAAGYSVSLFTHWTERRFDQVWIKTNARVDRAEEELFGARAADRNLNPLATMPAENCTPQMGAPGPWDERLPHFQMGFTPSAGDELQAEYIVPRQHAYMALCAVGELASDIAPLLHISEIRSIAADDLWMSMYYGRESIGIHFTWRAMGDEVAAMLPRIEERLAPFGARPHWGKLFARRHFDDLYERLPEFRGLAARLDPNGKFRNRYLEALLGE